MSQSEESFVDLITRLSMNQRLFVVRQEKERVTLEVQRKDIEVIVSSTPVLSFHILELMKERDRELAKLS